MGFREGKEKVDGADGGVRPATFNIFERILQEGGAWTETTVQQAGREHRRERELSETLGDQERRSRSKDKTGTGVPKFRSLRIACGRLN